MLVWKQSRIIEAVLQALTVDIKYAGTDPFTIYGGNTSGDTLVLRANTVDALPEFKIVGDAGTIIKMATGHYYIWLGDNAGTYTWNLCDSDGNIEVQADSLGNLATTGSISSSRIITFADGDTTPSVANADSFRFPIQMMGVNVTMFDDGAVGQTITILSGTTDTTIVDGANMLLAGNFICNLEDTLVLKWDGTNWNELSRSVNT